MSNNKEVIDARAAAQEMSDRAEILEAHNDFTVRRVCW